MTDQHNPDRPRSEDPLVQLMVSMTGAVAPEHETEAPGANEQAVRAGHEADRFDVRGILYVPAFVVAVLGIAYLLVSGIFFNIKDPAPDPAANPIATQMNQADLNDRFGRISSSEPQAPVRQPRLEGLKKVLDEDDPPHMRSQLPAPQGNSPEIYPHDLRAENYTDPASGRKILVEYGWADQAKGLATIPVDVAMDQIVKKLPVRKDAVKVDGTSVNRAKYTNSGRGGPSGSGIPAPTVPPAGKH